MQELQKDSTSLPKRIGVIGSGLIGCSLMLGLQRRHRDLQFVAFDQNDEYLEQADKLVGLEQRLSSVPELVECSDVVILATPPRATADILSDCRDVLNETLVTDVGSIKRDVCKMAQSTLEQQCGQFIPAHPIAGSEHHGPSAANATMFDDCTVIITPLEQNAAESVQTIVNLWHAAGASRVVKMDAIQHDQIFASTSHYPHALAYTLMHSLCQTLSEEDILAYSAGGLQSFTRIAESNPDLWCDILLANTDQVLVALQAFDASNKKLHALLRERDRKGLHELLSSVTELQSRINKNSQ